MTAEELLARPLKYGPEIRRRLEQCEATNAENAELKEVLKAQVVVACNERTAALEERLEQCEATLRQYADVGNWNRHKDDRPEIDWWVAPGNGYDAARAALEGK